MERGSGRLVSILTSRQHLLDEAESLLSALPLQLRDELPDSKAGQAAPGRAAGTRPPPAS